MPRQGQAVLLPPPSTSDKIIIRCQEDLYVEMTQAEAIPVVRSMLALCDDKLALSQTEISKIMASMREMENLITSYQTLAL
jgi:prefoldin subunit 5